ncbi:alpha-D-ribose 1-methylphosphonate 5-triphosphate diphosphatase [Nisaea acidiphila]|uniref:Alpha-D-ribose 1-methylphosphonate 5-triphosphate diphosphatase n=1 Tax=Nisaea acidiphila TaxID=1862145 RepID=A0A9J7AX26_9PROT|nr:alpha-D-ribose 1-methylphosphonate 5-triphosphate diphosphatase [Nisaea acidiphila]UUX50005.1 alpha-D-ribose 1-methylphosphonate 5-triphosphate diphosphatase [Nisaea acidiphila]
MSKTETPDAVLTNARIILPEGEVRGTVTVRGDKIEDISEGPVSLPGAIDYEGDFLIAGLVELHTDNLEKHLIPRPKVHWPVVSALMAHDAQVAAAGITTVLDAVAVGGTVKDDARDEILVESAAAIHEASENDMLRANHFLHMRCEVGNPRAVALFEPFQDDPLVRLVSLMDHTPGQRQFVDIEKLRVYYLGKQAMSDAEFDEMIEDRKKNQVLYSDKHRRTIAAACVARNIVTASHDDATEEHVDEAHELGLTISEFPTTLEAAKHARKKGLANIMGGPNVVRGGSHSGNVSAGELAEAGVLDALSSDYVPASLLHGAFLLNEKHGVPLPEAIATVTRNPARMVGLDDRGEIAPGKRADIVRVRQAKDGTPVIRKVMRSGLRVA